MLEKCQGIDDAPDHPDIDFEPYFILQIRINDFWGSVHGSSHRLHIFLNAVVHGAFDSSPVDHSIGAWPKVTQFKAIVSSNQHIFNFYILMITTNRVDDFQSLQNRFGDKHKFFFTKTFVLSLFQHIEEWPVGAELHEDDQRFILGSSWAKGHQLPSEALNDMIWFGKSALLLDISTINSSSFFARLYLSCEIQTILLRAYFYLVAVSSASQINPNAPSESSLISWIDLPRMLYFWGTREVS